MSAADKSKILSLVDGSGLPRQRALRQLGLPSSTFYRWLKRESQGSLQDRKGGSSVPWNKLKPKEEERILTLARASPEHSARQLALRIVDTEGFYISESTVYRILKREGLRNVTPYDVYTGRHLEILQRRKEVKNETLKARRSYNRTAREQGHSL